MLHRHLKIRTANTQYQVLKDVFPHRAGAFLNAPAQSWGGGAAVGYAHSGGGGGHHGGKGHHKGHHKGHQHGGVQGGQMGAGGGGVSTW